MTHREDSIGKPAASAVPSADIFSPERHRRRQLAAELFAEWLADESGHDERTYPALKSGIEEARCEMGAPSPFADETAS